jgi:hypothetical protein
MEIKQKNNLNWRKKVNNYEIIYLYSINYAYFIVANCYNYKATCIYLNFSKFNHRY